MVKKVFITGATGFIGGYLVDEAIARGYEVYTLLRNEAKRYKLKDKPVNIVKFDLKNANEVERVISEIPHFDYIIMNAGLTQSQKDKNFLKANYEYIRYSCELFKKYNKVPKKLIFMSTLGIYGGGEANTIKPITINSEKNPITSYAKSKLKAEEYIRNEYNHPYLIFNPTAVYGAGDKNFLMLFKLLKKRIEIYLGQKTQHISLIHAADLAVAIFLGIEAEIKNRSYLVSDGNYYTAIYFNSIIKECLNKKTIKIIIPRILLKLIANFNEKKNKLLKTSSILNKEKMNELLISNWICDTTPLEKELNFKARYSLEDGLKETLDWCKKEKLI